MVDINELVNFSIIVIDKPSEWTSFDVVNFVRKTLGLKKAGHLGTLDMKVTGVLPIVLGRACKIQEYLMHKDKVYIGKMKLHKEIEREKLEEGIKKFIGKIKQIPPRASRVKRQLREREVKRFEILKFDKDKREAEFIAEVEAGTYIRKLVFDLGVSLGIGANMAELRRIKAGIFSEEQACSIEKFKEAVEEWKKGNVSKLKDLIIDAKEVIKKIMPYVEIKKEFEERLKNGSPIFREMLKDEQIKNIKGNNFFAVFSDDKLIEIAKKSELQKNIVAKPQVVFR